MKVEMLSSWGDGLCVCPLYLLTFEDRHLRAIVPQCFVRQHIYLITRASHAEVLPAWLSRLLRDDSTRH